MHRRTYDPVLVLKIIPPYLSCVHKFSRIFLVPKRCSVIFILQKLSVSRQVFKLILIHLNSFSRLKLNLMRKYAKKLHIHALIQVFKPNSFSLWEKGHANRKIFLSVMTKEYISVIEGTAPPFVFQTFDSPNLSPPALSEARFLNYIHGDEELL